MGSHSRARHEPRQALAATSAISHRGASAPLIDLDLSGTAARAGAVLVGGATVATVVVAGAAGAIAAPAAPAGGTAAQFAAIRQCESGGNYATNTGNGYYGAYQFALGTWAGMGYGGLPSSASPATQDQAAERLQAARGWSPWPACSRRLGLGSTAPSRPTAPVAQPVAQPVSVHLSGGIPAFPGVTLTRAMISERRSDVMVWQARMARRGWDISVDGAFGPQSAHVAAAFTAEKHVVAPAGEVTAAVWRAAWTAPITR